MNEFNREAVEICGNACERALRNERVALALGDLEGAAYWADRAAFWSNTAFEAAQA